MWNIIIDVALILIIVVSAIIGIVKGLFDSVLSLIGTGIALAIAVFTAKHVSNFLNGIINIEQFLLDKIDAADEAKTGMVEFFGGKLSFSNVEVAKFGVWVITVIVIFLIIKLALFILSKLFESVVKNSPTISGINRVLGLIFGAIKGVFSVAVILAICSLASNIPFIGTTVNDKIEETKVASFAYKYVDDFVETQLTEDAIKDIISKIVTENKAPEGEQPTES